MLRHKRVIKVVVEIPNSIYEGLARYAEIRGSTVEETAVYLINIALEMIIKDIDDYYMKQR
ncbi:MAG: hypothetical protein QXH34_08005 [Ignisphaera sp.]